MSLIDTIPDAEINVNEPNKKYKVIGFRYPDSKDWLNCIDIKTGGTCVVHRSLL